MNKLKECDIQKKKLLDILYYDIGKQQCDFFICGTYGNRNFTKWKKYSESIMIIDMIDGDNKFKDYSYFIKINQRQILPNELVIDLEEPERIKEVCKRIFYKVHETNIKEANKINIKIYLTGSRGYHIHLFFNEVMTQKEKEHIIELLGTDLQKCTEKCLIALEDSPHWKTGKKKKEVSYEWVMQNN
jgi:hypothetical protein